MKFLVVAKQKKNVDTFEAVIAALLARGQTVTLAIQQRDPERDARLAERLRHERFALVACPDERTDAWRVGRAARAQRPRLGAVHPAGLPLGLQAAPARGRAPVSRDRRRR